MTNMRGICYECRRRRILYPDPESNAQICGECVEERKRLREERWKAKPNDISRLTKPTLIEVLKSLVLASGAEGKTIRVNYELIHNMRQLYDITIIRSDKDEVYDITVTERPA